MNLKFETIVQFFKKMMQLNAGNILKITNEYFRKIISKSSRKISLYPAMFLALLYLQLLKHLKNYT